MTSDDSTIRLFRTADAPAKGISKRQLAGLSDRRLTRGVYSAEPGRQTLSRRAQAVLMATGERTVLSHFTAARLLGGITPLHPDIHVTTPGSKRIQRTGVVAHRTVRPIRAQVILGLPVTTGAQTFLDLAPLLDLVDLVILGDSLVQRDVVTLKELRAAADAWRGSGVSKARQAARLVRKGVESPMETRLRLLIVFAGLPEPLVDHRMYRADGTLICRVDLSYVDYRLGIEYDGRQHAENSEQWRRDVRRREYLDGKDWRLVVVIGQEFYNDPADVLARIVTAARHNGMTIGEPNSHWRRYFRAKK